MSQPTSGPDALGGRPAFQLRGIRKSVLGTVAVRDVDLAGRPGEVVGLVGRNGAGKSTLMKLISGALPPSSGDRVASPDLIVGNFAQLEVDRLDSRDTALLALTRRIDEIGARSQWDEQRRRNHLGGFGFRGDRVFEPVVHFSGGERARLALAILVAERPNLLLLDEPTNHLDFEMRHSLITALQGFAGAVIVVSHDRGLLRSVCDQFWLVADGAAADFDGDLEDYAGWLEKRASAATTPAAPKPKQKQKPANESRPTRDQESRRKEVRAIETSLDKLGQERAKVEKELAGMDFARDPAHARKVGQRHQELQAEIEQLETRWLELTERLESLNG
jgi:ATP-binding cassette subfamily F protein 3